MLVSGAVIYTRVAGMTDTRPRHEIPPPVLYTFAPTLAQPHLSSMTRHTPRPRATTIFTSQHGTSSPPGTSYSPWS